MAQEQRISRPRAVSAAGAALVAGAALGADVAPGLAQTGTAPTGMVGVWMVSSTRAGQLPNGVLVTVHPDGTFLRIGSDHPREAPGVGIWQQVSEGVYDVNYVSLQFDNTGAFAGRRKAIMRITLDPGGTTFRGEAYVTFSDPNGVADTPISAEIVGTRMTLEPYS